MSETAPAIQVRGLRHAFKKHQALESVTFTVPRGTIHGFVGPNGAGKTTTLKGLATLLTPDQGSIHLFGEELTPAAHELRRRIGFMPDHFSMYRQMTVFEYLDFFAAAYGFSGPARDKAIDDVLALTDMSGRKADAVKGLSRGMQQRVSLARVLVHDPDLLLLDEPASGLDPRARIELMEILKELKRMGKTVFISSHILAELGTLCDGVTIIDRGTVKYCGPVAELVRANGGDPDLRAWQLTVAAPVAGLAEALTALPGVSAVTSDAEFPARLRIEAKADAGNRILVTVMDQGAAVVEFREQVRELGEVFMDLTTAGVRDA